MSLHDRIMNIKVTPDLSDHDIGEQIIYKTGHRDARHEAAKIAKDADMVMHRLALVLEEAVEWNWMDDIEPVPETVTKQINDAMNAYNDLLVEGRK